VDYEPASKLLSLIRLRLLRAKVLSWELTFKGMSNVDFTCSKRFKVVALVKLG